MKKFFLLLAAAGLLMASCGKKDRDTAQTASKDNAEAEIAFDDMCKQADFACREQAAGLKTEQWTCATVTVSPADTTTFPKTITVDFGTTGCTGPDGIIRKGKLSIHLTGKYRSVGTVMTVTPIDYYRNGDLIEGTKTVTNKGKNGDNQTFFEIAVTDGKITTEDNREISWNSTRKRVWVEGENTTWPNYSDDVYEISGTANGVSSEGKIFNIIITEPLIIKMNCKWISGGIIEITPEGVPTRKIDFGDGTCDNEALLIYKKKEYSITLH